jgi:site-specific DNA recombinase
MSFDGYVRVSSTKGRNGERFISPDVQRDTVERLAAAKGVTLGEIVEDLDVSGGKRVADRELGRLVERIENGESDGLIVWKVSRFSRSLLDAVTTATRIKESGGRLIAEDFDSAQPMGKAMLGLMAGLAEEELDARRQGWSEARRRALERGVPNGRVPLGYRKRPDGRPEIGKRQAAKVREAFKLRAQGEAFSLIAAKFGFRRSRMCRGWSTSFPLAVSSKPRRLRGKALRLSFPPS